MKKRVVSVITVVAVLLCLLSANVFAVGENFSFTRESLDLFIGQSYQLQLNESRDNVTYTTTDPNVVTVSPTGMVTAVSLGSSVITAYGGIGVETHCSVNVIAGTSPESVRLNSQSISLTEGESFALKATVLPEDTPDSRVKYSSSDDTVARVDENGYVKALKPGVAVITAESVSAAVSEKCIVKVSSKAGRTSFSVNITGTLYSIAGEKKVNMLLVLSNDKESFETTTDANGRYYFDDIIQGSYTLSVYSNNQTKKPTATGQLAVGSYNMTVTTILNGNELVLLYQDQHSSSEKARDVTLEKSTLNLETGTAYDMSFRVSPSGAALPVMTGKSDNEAVAVVDVDGRITALSEGSAKITFISDDGKIKKTCQVTVVKAASNTHTWLILLFEGVIIILIVVMFFISYRKFTKKKERAEELAEKRFWHGEDSQDS